MTIWFRIKGTKKNTAPVLYLTESVVGADNKGDPEKMVLVPNNDGTFYMTGSARISPATAEKLRGLDSDIEIFDHWPPTAGEGGWEPKT